MAHASLKLIPGVDQNRTPALNEAAINETQLIRFMPDRGGQALPQKFGGWEKYSDFGVSTSTIALHAWVDLNADKRVEMVGVQSVDAYDDLGNNPKDITPQRYLSEIGTTATFSATSGSAEVLITDTGSNLSNYDSVLIATEVSIGGLILFGSYPVQSIDVDSYVITAHDVLGNETPATSTSTTATVPVLDFTSGSTVVTVTLTDVNMQVGNTFTVLVPFYTSGVLIYGDYVVQTVTSVDEFTILASGTATATATVNLNGNKVRLIYSVGAQPPSQSVGYGVGGYGAGGYGSGVTGTGVRTLTVTDVALDVATGDALLYFDERLWIPPGSVISVTDIATSAPVTLFTARTTTVNNGFVLPAGGLVQVDGPATAGVAATGTLTVQVWQLASDLLWPLAQIDASNITNNGLIPALGFYRATIDLPYVLKLPDRAWLFISGSSSIETFSIRTTDNGTSSSVRVFNGVGSPYLTTSVGGYIIPESWNVEDQEAATIASWGGSTLTCYRGGPIYYYDPLSGYDRVKNLPFAPQVNEGVFVSMPQRQAIAYGSTFTGIQDPLLVRWCDVQNLDSWVGTVVNQAGSYRLSSGSKIVSGMQANHQGLLWTDTSLWSMQFIGLPYVYSFNEVATGCGLIGQKAATVMSGVAYWMGQGQFYSYGGEGITTIPCPIWDVVFQDIDKDYPDSVIAAPNSRFGEVMWFYPVTGSEGVPTNYAKFNTLIQQWDYGTLTRTAWQDQSVFTFPIGSDGPGYIYSHETGLNADGQPMESSFTSGMFALSDGDLKSFIDQVWPDMKWGLFGGSQDAEVEITFYTSDYPGGPTAQHGPYVMGATTPQYITPRIRARLVQFKLSSSDMDSFWRLGNIRYRIQQDGKY